MATASAVTAWGKPTIKSGASGESGALGTTLEDVGKIKENTTSLELVKGNVNELFGEGHELVDKMELEGTWTLKFTVIKASLDKIAKFFGLSVSTDKLAMKTTIVSEPRSYTVDPLLVAAIGDKVNVLVASKTKEVHAGNVIKELAPIVDGRGGGKPDMAMAGGSDANGIQDLLSAVSEQL